MYITKEIHACIMYVSYIQLFYAITKKSYIIATKENGWRLEIKGENVCTQAYFCICNHFMYYSSILFLEGCVRLHGHWLLYGLHVDLCMKYAKKLCPLRWYSKSLIIYSKKRSQKDMNNNLLLVLIGYRLNWVRE